MAGALQSLREAEWLDGGRVRAYARMLGAAWLVLLGTSFVDAMAPAGSDFLAFWGAGVVTAAGDPAAAYDLVVQERVQTATGAAGWFAFVNPPPFLFLVAPFGLLTFPLAWIAWVALTWAAWAWAAIRAFPRLWLIVLVFPGALLAAGHAQNGLLTGALLIGGVTLVDRRPILAGALLGALVIKPHLALLVPFWLAAGGRWRTFAAAGVSAAGLLLLSWVAFGTQIFVAYSTSWEASAAIMRTADADLHLRMASLYAQLRLIASAGVALAAHCVISAAMIVLVTAGWRRLGNDAQATGALLLAASASASPYLFNYDLPFLIVPLLWLVQRGLRDGFRPYERLILVALFLAPYATRAAALPLGVNLMPLVSLVFVALIWSRTPPERA